MAGGLRRLITGYPELAAVLAAAAVGLTVQPPLAWLASHQGISILLAVLVLATGVTIEPAALRGAARSWPSLLAVVAVGITVLPALSWALSRFVAAGPLRDGVMTVGLAPCEIASVAVTAMAGGEAALSAGVLIGSTVTTVAVAGPVLAFEAEDSALRSANSLYSASAVDPGHIIASLSVVVALPLAAGVALRARVPVARRAGPAAAVTATAAVAALVAVIASQVRLSGRYLPVAAALVLFLAGSAVAGRLLGVRPARPAAAAVLLTTSMRDFAIAAGLAAAAFGPAAAAPLGLYGILVLAWGTAAAGVLRLRSRPEGETGATGTIARR
jgi:predicted Na+-dependent transporter